MKKKLGKVLNIIVTILIVLVLIISVFVLVLTFTSKSESGIQNILGKAPISVLTDSMKGDDKLDFNKGDLLICDVIENPAFTEHKVGEVVTFVQDVDGDGFEDYVTHRIYKVNKDGTYLTKGDNNETYDQNSQNSVVFPNIVNSDILAVYNGTKISGLGNVLSFLQTQQGFFFAILLPMIIFFLYEGVRVVLNVVAYTKEKALAKAQETIANADLTEEQKQRAIEEYLAAQRANEQPAQTAPEADESSEEKTDAPGE